MMDDMTMPEVQKLAKSLGIEGKLAGKGVTKRLLIQKVKDKQNKTPGEKRIRFPCKHKLPALYNETLFKGMELDQKCVLSTGNSGAKVYWHVPEKSFCCKIPATTETLTQQQKRFRRVIQYKLATTLAPEIRQCVNAFMDFANEIPMETSKSQTTWLRKAHKLATPGKIVFEKGQIVAKKLGNIVKQLVKYAPTDQVGSLLKIIFEVFLQVLGTVGNTKAGVQLMTMTVMGFVLMHPAGKAALAGLDPSWIMVLMGAGSPGAWWDTVSNSGVSNSGWLGGLGTGALGLVKGVGKSTSDAVKGMKNLATGDRMRDISKNVPDVGGYLSTVGPTAAMTTLAVAGAAATVMTPAVGRRIAESDGLHNLRDKDLNRVLGGDGGGGWG